MNADLTSTDGARGSSPSVDAPCQGPQRRVLLDVRDLRVAFAKQEVVHGLNMVIHAGERVALVGESGSGKTVSALSLLGLVNQARVSGQVWLQRGGESGQARDLLTLSPRELRGVRGQDVAVVFQEPMSALNPLMTVGAQLAEVLQFKRGLSAEAAQEEVLYWLAQTGLDEPQRRASAYVHQLSGGQRQRVLLAMALCARPSLLIADEPTTALDVGLRGQILELLSRLQREQGLAVLLITHDLPLVRRFADQVVVMQHGHVVEQGAVGAVFAAPKHPYTRSLLQSQPPPPLPAVPTKRVLLQTQALSVTYPVKRPGIKGWWSHAAFVAVHQATLALRHGQTVGVVGESGSGKSSLALAILGLTPAQGGLSFPNGSQPTQAGSADNVWLSVRRQASQRALRRRVQVVFQDPFSSLSPRMTVAQLVGEGLSVHWPQLDAAARQDRVCAALVEVGLSEHPQAARSWLNRYPHECSGGQRQRLAIARALVVEPEILVLDEPTSALDVSVQRQVLSLLQRLQQEKGLAYLLITHDMGVVRCLAHEVLVMHRGHVVEQGGVDQVLGAPTHAHTRALMSAL